MEENKVEETETETTKKQKRLTWEAKEVTYTATIHIAGGAKVVVDMRRVFPGFADLSDGRKQLLYCGIREKTSQVLNQAISVYQKANKEGIKEGRFEPLPANEHMVKAVELAFKAFEHGVWPTEVRTPAEPKVKLSEVKAAMLERMLEQGIPEDVARSIIAKL